LPGHQVRFDAISGDFRFIISGSGSPSEVLATNAFATTDESGRASVRIRALAAVPNQTAILQVTDLVGGASRQVAFTIAQSTGTSPGFFATPTSATFQGSLPGQCANAAVTNNLSATFYIFGGTPPYTITSPNSGLVVTRQVVSSNGGSFDVRPAGICLTDVPILITDASGHTTTVTVSNIPGVAPTTPLAVSPTTVNLSSCSSVASLTAAGGTGNYVASSGSGGVYVVRTSGSNTFQIGRVQDGNSQTSPVTVGITDGVTNQNVTVTLTGQALGRCPPGPFTAQPTDVSLTSCTGTAQVILSGGSGVYTASSNSSSVSVTVTGGTLQIGRNSGPAAPGAAATVTASDGNSPLGIHVNDFAGTCP
jgi:VCBS repeat-containing protein